MIPSKEPSHVESSKPHPYESLKRDKVAPPEATTSQRKTHNVALGKLRPIPEESPSYPGLSEARERENAIHLRQRALPPQRQEKTLLSYPRSSSSLADLGQNFVRRSMSRAPLPPPGTTISNTPSILEAAQLLNVFKLTGLKGGRALDLLEQYLSQQQHALQLHQTKQEAPPPTPTVQDSKVKETVQDPKVKEALPHPKVKIQDSKVSDSAVKTPKAPAEVADLVFPEPQTMHRPQIQQVKQYFINLKDLFNDPDNEVLESINTEDKKLSILAPKHRFEELQQQHASGKIMQDGVEYDVVLDVLTPEQYEELQAENEEMKKEIEEHLAILDQMLAAIHPEGQEKDDTKITNSKLEDGVAQKTTSKGSLLPSEAIILLRGIVAKGDSVAPIMEAARKWNKKMIEMFIKQLEKEYQIKKEDVAYAMKQQAIHKDAVDIAQKNQTQLRKPEHLSMLQKLVKNLYELHETAKAG